MIITRRRMRLLARLSSWSSKTRFQKLRSLRALLWCILRRLRTCRRSPLFVFAGNRLSGRTDFSGKRWSMLGHHTCSFDLEENGKDIFVCFPHCQDRIHFFFEIQTGSWLQRRPKSTALSLSASNFFKHFPITEKKTDRSVWSRIWFLGIL